VKFPVKLVIIINLEHKLKRTIIKMAEEEEEKLL